MSTLGRSGSESSRSAAARRRIRVLLVEDHLVLAESFAAVLRQEAAIELIGIASTAADAGVVAEDRRPDVVVMDVRLPDRSGIDAAMSIKAMQKDTGIIFLTAYDNVETLWHATEAGAAAFLPKSEAVDTVVEAIKRVAAGEILLEPGRLQDALAWHRARRRQEQERQALLRSITAREMEVLRLLAAGDTTSTIASQLHITVTTVKTHVRSLLAKLDAHSQLQAVAKALALELIPR